MSAAFILHFAVTWALVGLVWCVQLLIYPQFPHYAAEKFRECHFGHCFRIALLVVPLMVLEVASAVWLLFEGLRSGAFLVSAWLLPVVWLSTAVWQAPAHLRLVGGFDGPLVRKLIATNWVRTATWTVRGVLVGVAAL